MTRALHIAHDGAGVDLEAAARAAADFLAALGVAIENEDLRQRPSGGRLIRRAGNEY
jgi:hypothetical protein